MFLKNEERERGYRKLFDNTKGPLKVSDHELKADKVVCLNFILVTFSCLGGGCNKERVGVNQDFIK